MVCTGGTGWWQLVAPTAVQTVDERRLHRRVLLITAVVDRGEGQSWAIYAWGYAAA